VLPQYNLLCGAERFLWFHWPLDDNSYLG